MPTGKLSIVRGRELEQPPLSPRLSIVPCKSPSPAAPLVAEAAPASSAAAEYHLVHDRLTALERLARLRDLSAISAAEYENEKAIVLSLPADALVPVPLVQPQGPSLLGRLLRWRFLPVGVAAGLVFSLATQPRETIGLFDEMLRLVGA